MTGVCMASNLQTPFCMLCIKDQTGAECVGSTADYLSICSAELTPPAAAGANPSPETCSMCIDPLSWDCSDAILAVCAEEEHAFCPACQEDSSSLECVKDAIGYVSFCFDDGTGPVVLPTAEGCGICELPTTAECYKVLTDACVKENLAIPFCMSCLNDKDSVACLGGAVTYLRPCYTGAIAPVASDAVVEPPLQTAMVDANGNIMCAAPDGCAQCVEFNAKCESTFLDCGYDCFDDSTLCEKTCTDRCEAEPTAEDLAAATDILLAWYDCSLIPCSLHLISLVALLSLASTLLLNPRSQSLGNEHTY
jgi:hypothetical protein